MITAQNRENQQSKELSCSPRGELLVTTGPASFQAFFASGSIADSDLYLLGVVLNGGSAAATVAIESDGATVLYAKAEAGKTTYIPLPAPIRCIGEGGLVVTLTGTGASCTVFYMPG